MILRIGTFPLGERNVPEKESPMGPVSVKSVRHLMLDGLQDDRPLVRLVTRSWLRDALCASVDRILDPLLGVLQFWKWTAERIQTFIN